MPNRLEYIVADQGIIQSGGAKVALNDMLGDDEVIHILANSNSRLAIVARNRFEVILKRRDELPELETVVGLVPEDECPAGILLQAGLLKGTTHYIEQQFDPGKVIERISRDGVTFTFMVPTMIYRVLDWIENEILDLGSLRTVLYGAAPITAGRLRQGIECLGPVFMQLYGQSEAPNFVTRLVREDHDPAHPERLLSCGRAVAMAQVRIVDSNGNDVPTGHSGELVTRTPYNMIGYHGLPEKTAETIVDGWLHTGDIARMDDDDYVYLLDRKNDMIISGGMSVYTSEVENVIQGIPGINQGGGYCVCSSRYRPNSGHPTHTQSLSQPAVQIQGTQAHCDCGKSSNYRLRQDRQKTPSAAYVLAVMVQVTMALSLVEKI